LTPLLRRRAIIIPGRMLSFRPSAPLCAPSRLRHLCWLIALSLSSVSLAADPDCPGSTRATPAREQGNNRKAQAAAPKRPPPGRAGGKIDVTSDEATLATNGDATLQGNVRVRQGDREIRAEDVEYDGDNNAFKVRGKVHFEDPLVNVTGNDGNYSPTAGADFKAAEFQMKEPQARGEAKSLNLTPQGILRLEGVRFTTCPLNDQSWELMANSLRLDTGQQVGSGRGARVDFKGVPILYMPWLTFPLGDQRKSGFLFPSGGHTTRSGFQVAVPYYFNLAPNFDYTFEPVFYSRRGLDFSGDTRYMSPRNRTDLVYHILPSDDLVQDDRSYVNLKHTTELPADFRFRIDAANASDNQYFEDFAQGPEGTSVAFVERLAQLTYRDEHWRFAAEAQQFQTITQTLLDVQQPYARVPRIIAAADFGLGPDGVFRYGLDSEVVNFQRDTGVTGWRVDATPVIGFDFEGAGYFMRPEVAWRYTSYQLDDTLVGQDDSPSRSLSIASLDTGLLFERPSGSRGQRTLTLEPRALYLHVPFRNQDALPMFDTGLPDLSLVQLFRTNRYVGADRVSDANQISVGVTSRLLDTATGTQFLAATLGQTLYFDTPRVTIPGEIPRTGDTSDFIAQLTLTAYKDWNIDLGTQWNPDSNQTQRSTVNLQYRPEDDQVVNLGYRFQRGRIEQSDVSTAFPLTQKWNAFARYVYSMRDDKALERFLGFEYRSCCWRARVLGRRFVSNRTGEQDTGVYLQLELNGLASVGSAADSFLETAIRGYSPLENQLFDRQGK
jgi:LPS-assembly protein